MKKIVGGILGICVVSIFVFSLLAQGDNSPKSFEENRFILYGDVDEDGNITSYDAALTLQYAAGLISGWTEDQIIAGDVNADVNITSYDAALIIQYSAELIDEFPCEKVIIIYGDTRSQREIRIQVAQSIAEEDPLIIFHSGDFCRPGHIQETWDNWWDDCEFLVENFEFVSARGNHDTSFDSTGAPIPDIFMDNLAEHIPPDADWDGENTWFSLNRKQIHFIILDSNQDYGADISEGSPQYNWFVNDLENIGENIRTTIVIMHHPPYSTGPHSSNEEFLQETLVPLFEEYEISLVFCGHNHSYERLYKDGVYYIVAAGGGAPLYAQNPADPDMQYSQLYIMDYHFCELDIYRDNLLFSAVDTTFTVFDSLIIELDE